MDFTYQCANCGASTYGPRCYKCGARIKTHTNWAMIRLLVGTLAFFLIVIYLLIR
jgi:hypothetical protein